MLGGEPEIKPQIRGSTMWAKLNNDDVPILLGCNISFGMMEIRISDPRSL